MISGLIWSNLLSYSAQVLVLVAAAAVLQLALRVRLPRAHLAFCQLLLLACLVLPIVQPWHRPMIVVPEEPPPAVTVSLPLPAQSPSPQPAIPWGEMALFVLAAGAGLRVLWLVLGLARLGRYRAAATPLYPLPDAVEAARARTGGEALVCVSDAVEGPVTFGFLFPVILLPPALLDQPFESQCAVATHEFLHVRRRDWLLTMCEELAGAVLWFHPAVWWLLAQIRLAREQVVDRQVVSLTSERDPYVSALLSMAGARPRLDLAPATLFLRKRHLAQRIGSLLKEVSMSKRRLVSSYVSIAVVLVAAVWATAALFPLTGSAQVVIQQGAVADANGVTVQAGGQILHRTPVRYPAGALQGRIAGVVVVSLSLDADGAVTDARVLSGPEELRRGVLEAVLQWHYLNTSKSPNTVQATIEFRIPETPPPPPPPPAGTIGAAPATAPPPPPPPVGATAVPPQTSPATSPQLLYRTLDRVIGSAPSATQGTQPVLESIDISTLSEPLQNMLREKLTPFIGQPVSSDLINKIREAVTQVDSHLGIGTGSMRTGGGMVLSIRIMEGSALFATPAPAPTPQTNFPSTPGVERIRVGGDAQVSKLINAPAAEYPPLACRARISGVVRFNAVIGTDGHIVNLQLVSGHPLLVPPAQVAASQYVYQPTLLNGQKVEVVTTISVNFTYTPQCEVAP